MQFAAQQFDDGALRMKVLFEQLKMIKESLQKVAGLESYTKKAFRNDIYRILPQGSFKDVDNDKLKKYISSLKFSTRLKNESIILAIVNTDYDAIWRYIKYVQIYNKLHFWGKA